jgi:choline monooxygenase
MTLRQVLSEFDASRPIEEARTPPAQWYRHPEILKLEREAVLGASWQFAAPLDQVADAGSFVASQIGRDNVVVVRDHDGELRAFANICRHNGTALVKGCGQAEQLQCPYHGWRYGLDGRLLSAPRTAGLRDFDRADFGLIELEIWVLGPLVMVSPSGSQKPPALAPLMSRLAQTNWSQLRYHSQHSYHLDCNWKVVVDNYLDGGYHINTVHPELGRNLDQSAYRTELFDGFSIQSATASATATERLSGEAIYAWLYPNLMINRYGPMLDINVVHPTGPEQCQVDFYWFFKDDCTEAFIEQSLADSDRVQQEDMRICAQVQRGLGDRHFRPGPYAPKVEMSKYQFHGMLAADLHPHR